MVWATVRQAMSEQLMEMLSKMDSQTALQLLDLVLDMMDLPGKEEIVARVRKLNGQTDPNEEESPEAMAERQARQQDEEQVKALELKEIMSKIEERLAKVEQTRVNTQKAAMETGQVVAATPGVAPAADQILKEAGFEGQAGGETAQVPAQLPAETAQLPVERAQLPAPVEAL